MNRYFWICLICLGFGTGIIIGQHLTLMRVNSHIETLSIENGYLLSEKRYLVQKVGDLEARLGIKQGKGKMK